MKLLQTQWTEVGVTLLLGHLAPKNVAEEQREGPDPALTLIRPMGEPTVLENPLRLSLAIHFRVV